MWKVLIALIFNTIASFGYSQESVFNITPRPRSIKQSEGIFAFNSKTIITVNNSKASPTAEKFSEKFSKTYKFKLKVDTTYINSKTSNTIWFLLSSDKVLGKDGYKITIRKEQIWIEANEESGFSNATESLFQLLPSDKEDTKCHHTYSIPCGEIVNYTDY